MITTMSRKTHAKSIRRRRCAESSRILHVGRSLETLEARTLLAADGLFDSQAMLSAILDQEVCATGDFASSPAFGRRIAGTYFGTGEATGIDATIVDILTFHEDGTFTGTANDDFGFGDIALNGFNSPEHGAWRRTGPRDIASASLAFGYDANGVLENIFRITSESTFGPNFESVDGSFRVDVFLADQDPLSDDPVASLPGTYQLERVHVTSATDGALARKDRHAVPPGFGQHVAGTFFGTGEATGIDSSIVDILTFNRDGTFSGTANDDFGFGDIQLNGFNSPEHGTWARTGPRSIGTTSLALGYDANGVFENIFRITSEATFTPDFETIEGSFSVDVFLADQNPLTDDPVASIPGTYDLDRLNVMLPDGVAERGEGGIGVPPGFGRNAAATVFGTGAATGISSPIIDILTFNGDGTMTGTANDDYGFGDILLNGFNSPEHGVWRRIGPHEIATTSLALGYSATGVLENIFRIRSVATVSADYSHLNGTFTVDVFLAAQDPLADEPVATLPGTYEFNRLQVPPPVNHWAAAIDVVFADRHGAKHTRSHGR